MRHMAEYHCHMAETTRAAPGALMTPADQAAIALLGFRTAKRKTGLDVIKALREGLSYRAFERVTRLMELQEKELSLLVMLGYSRRTAQRVRSEQRRLEAPYADRLFRMARVIARATEVLESEEKARKWLFRENRALGGQKPFELLDTKVGADEVERVLGRIEHGVFS